MKKKYIILSVVLIGAVVAFALFSKAGLGSKEGQLEVEILKLSSSELTEVVSATGKIQPEVEIKISSEVSGEIINLPIKEGQLVKKGDLLVGINPDLYESGVDRSVAALSNTKAGLNQAEAQLKEALSNYKRNESLFEKGIISRSEWDKVVSAYEVAQAVKKAAHYSVESAQASVTESRDNLNRTTIYAPVDGTISRLDVEMGERVLGTQQMTGTELLRVANLNNMEVEVDVNENDIVKIKVGNTAKIEVDAYLKMKFDGIVTSISNSASTALTADQVTNFKVKVRILKESYQAMMEGKAENYSPFRPGMTATVDIVTQQKQGVYAVPISAIVMKSAADTISGVHQEEAGNSLVLQESVFVKNGDVAEIRFVKTGIQDDKNIEITQGLKPDDLVIAGPYATVNRELKSGDRVVDRKTVIKK